MEDIEAYIFLVSSGAPAAPPRGVGIFFSSQDLSSSGSSTTYRERCQLFMHSSCKMYSHIYHQTSGTLRYSFRP